LGVIRKIFLFTNDFGEIIFAAKVNLKLCPEQEKIHELEKTQK
jgi:hypothetical protein